ncbi:MAG: YceI family protein [Melioribacteraceae bacterium]|nr:YceI family protein [Melioribacteraceae bacterium]
MKRILILSLILAVGLKLNAQKHMTQNGVISFFSSTPVENIEAINNQVSAVINSQNGELAAVLLVKAFNFEKALMQEHFNEKYVESHKYPKSVFKGRVIDFDKLELNGTMEPVNLKGELTIHGITNSIIAEGTISKENTSLNLNVEFNVKVTDYEIKIPKTVRDNIAEEIMVTVRFKLDEV